MKRLPSDVSPRMATKMHPGFTLRESYSTLTTPGFPLLDKTSAPSSSCSKVIARNYRAREAGVRGLAGKGSAGKGQRAGSEVTRPEILVVARFTLKSGWLARSPGPLAYYLRHFCAHHTRTTLV